MSYQLKPQESVPDGVRRIVLERLEKAIAQLTQDAEENPDEAIHGARKRFKEIRAVVRLVRDELGADVYQQENARFRDVGRQLSSLRDAQVRIETLDDLVKHFEAAIAPDAFRSIHDILEADYQATRKVVLQQKNQLESVVSTLQTAQRHIQNWPLKQEGWSAMGSSLKRVYQRGYQGLNRAGDRPTPENLHEWRKRVKYLWYHTRILKPIWPGTMSELSDQLKDLADALGDDHDLAVLRQFIADQPELFNGEDQLGVLLALINRRQFELQTAARHLGQRIYAESPKKFVARLKSYWQTWQAESQQPPIPLLDTESLAHRFSTAQPS